MAMPTPQTRSRKFHARYTGTCTRCDQPIEKDELIERAEGGYGHVTCPPDPETAAEQRYFDLIARSDEIRGFHVEAEFI